MCYFNKLYCIPDLSVNKCTITVLLFDGIDKLNNQSISSLFFSHYKKNKHLKQYEIKQAQKTGRQEFSNAYLYINVYNFIFG